MILAEKLIIEVCAVITIVCFCVVLWNLLG